VRVSKEKAHEILTVQQLIDAVRPSAGTGPMTEDRGPRTEDRGRTVLDDSWAVLLRDLPAEQDASLSWLLRRRWFMAPATFVISRVVRLLLGRMTVSGLGNVPAHGPFLICPNHQSYIDPICLCTVVPYRTFSNQFYVGAVEYFETSVTRWIARAINLVPVDPDSNLVPAMQAGAFGLRHGKILVLFPEGERSIDGSVKRFKKGAPILARHLGVPIVPVALHGIHEIWPRGRGINWSMLMPFSGHRVTIAFGEPMRFAEGETYADAALRLRDQVARMWEHANRKSLKHEITNARHGTNVAAEPRSRGEP